MSKGNFNKEMLDSIGEYLDQIIDNSITLEQFSDFMMVLQLKHRNDSFVKGLSKIGFDYLTAEEQAFLIFHCDHVLNWGIDPLNTRMFNGRKCWSRLEKGQRELLKKGIIEYLSTTSDAPEKVVDRKDKTILSPDTIGKLFRGYEELISVNSITRQASIIKSSSILPKNLYFDSKIQEQVERVEKLLNPENYDAIMERMEIKGRRKSAAFLFHGAPGTGKTELAKQLAHKTGRDIILIDVAKLNSSFTGDTEKNYRELFRAYRYLVHLSPKAPILLFNEADGVLSKRGDVLRQAVDKICNRIQSLLLQEIEDFEGIMIATTNLAENMDDAFDRRFLFKIKFEEPDIKTRTLIWKSMIPELNDELVNILAARYKFTGAQIDNIAKKRDIDEMLDGVAPSVARMIEYCEAEILIAVKDGDIEKTLPITLLPDKTYRMKS